MLRTSTLAMSSAIPSSARSKNAVAASLVGERERKSGECRARQRERERERERLSGSCSFTHSHDSFSQ